MTWNDIIIESQRLIRWNMLMVTESIKEMGNTETVNKAREVGQDCILSTFLFNEYSEEIFVWKLTEKI